MLTPAPWISSATRWEAGFQRTQNPWIGSWSYTRPLRAWIPAWLMNWLLGDA